MYIRMYVYVYGRIHLLSVLKVWKEEGVLQSRSTYVSTLNIITQEIIM